MVGRWMITPSSYLDAVELLCGETRGETRQRDVLGFLPIRITAAIVRPPEDIAEGTRKLLEDRHFRSAHRFVPVIMSSHRFRGWSILPLLPPPPLLLLLPRASTRGPMRYLLDYPVLINSSGFIFIFLVGRHLAHEVSRERDSSGYAARTIAAEEKRREKREESGHRLGNTSRRRRVVLG